jgi:hypothetical protein
LTLTPGIDTPTEGFTSGHGATATAADAVFVAPAGSSPIGLSNTLNAGDVLLATGAGAAAGTSTLNVTEVAPPIGIGNPAFAPGVTMTSVNAAVITNLSGDLGGFSGTVTGLTTATVAGGSTGDVQIGGFGAGLNTALTTINLNAAVDFEAVMTAAALAAAPTATINPADPRAPQAFGPPVMADRERPRRPADQSRHAVRHDVRPQGRRLRALAASSV